MSNRLRTCLIVISTCLFLFILYERYFPSSTPTPRADITTFEECVAAGYPVRESYPETCRTPVGNTFTRVTPVSSPQAVTLSGTYTCLPKKDTGKPVTMECAFGLKTSDGYYALDLSAIPTKDYPALTGNDSITVVGTRVPNEMVSQDRFATYDVLGVIAVDRIVKLNP